jgi:hypothetical protein
MGGDVPQEHEGLAVREEAGGEGDVADFKHEGKNSEFEIRSSWCPGCGTDLSTGAR